MNYQPQIWPYLDVICCAFQALPAIGRLSYSIIAVRLGAKHKQHKNDQHHQEIKQYYRINIFKTLLL